MPKSTGYEKCGLNALQVREYASCEYIERKDNLVFLGRHGTGKSHAATVFGVEACRQGHRVVFTTAAHLVNQLIEAREERQLQRYLNKLSRMGLLIIDELGYIPLSDTGAQLLFQVFADRYERASTLVTTNLPFADWTRVFGDASLTAALLDTSVRGRFTHGGSAGPAHSSLSHSRVRLGEYPAYGEPATSRKAKSIQ